MTAGAVRRPPRVDGGIGRRVGLRIQWSDPWGFKSPSTHLRVRPQKQSDSQKGTPLEVTITPLSEVEQQASIALTHEDLQPHFALAYERFRPKAEVRGFRKGRVPLDLIRKMYGEAIEHDALDSIADDVYRHAMEEHKVRPLGQPAMMDMDLIAACNIMGRDI